MENHLVSKKTECLHNSTSHMYGNRTCLMTFAVTHLLFLADLDIMYSFICRSAWTICGRAWWSEQTDAGCTGKPVHPSAEISQHAC